jgi:hypothetical protein
MPGVRLQRYVRDDGIGTPNGRAGWNPDALRRDIRRPSTVSTGAVRADLCARGRAGAIVGRSHSLVRARMLKPAGRPY